MDFCAFKSASDVIERVVETAGSAEAQAAMAAGLLVEITAKAAPAPAQAPPVRQRRPSQAAIEVPDLATPPGAEERRASLATQSPEEAVPRRTSVAPGGRRPSSAAIIRAWIMVPGCTAWGSAWPYRSQPSGPPCQKW